MSQLQHVFLKKDIDQLQHVRQKMTGTHNILHAKNTTIAPFKNYIMRKGETLSLVWSMD